MNKKLFVLFLAICTVASCSVREMEGPQAEAQGDAIRIAGDINQEYATRADDQGFADKDEIGIFVVDYDGSTPGTLKPRGNRADNLRFTFDEPSWKWIPDHEIYYKDKITHIDVYGYYPYSSPESVDAFVFEVQKDQSLESGNGKMGGYEASDFLWGKAADVAPSDRTITINFKHMMAMARITLAQGTGFDSAEWASLEKSVITESAIRTSTIDLKTGVVTVTGSRPATGTIACRYGNDWRCIIVPQTIAAGEALFSMNVGGLPYSLRKGDDFTFVAGKQHNFTITVNKRSDTGTYEFVLTGESITPWENDPVSHDAVAREYVIVNVPEAGTLDKCIEASGKDLSKVRNIKVTGQINNFDFAVLRDEMNELQSLNLKEVRIVKGSETYMHGVEWIPPTEPDQIPVGAMTEKISLMHLVLPDVLTFIGRRAFAGCRNLTGSLIIPEGVIELEEGAFGDCTNMSGSLYLPNTLKIIGDDVFGNASFSCELKFPESLEVIGRYAFNNCTSLYGDLHLPSHLRELGEGAFRDCTSMTGSIEIPQTLTIIPDFAFFFYYDGHLTGTLKLHDGITSIGKCAFTNTHLRGELNLPKDLVIISEGAFSGCDFSGTLNIPEGVAVIGRGAFAYNWRLMGTITIPKNVQSIGEEAFKGCGGLEGLILEDGIETIGRYAFDMCTGLGSIVSKCAVPPHLQAGAFDGVPKDNFTIEVPESAIATYSTEPGWSDFKRISAYRNLVIRPSVATAINSAVTRELVLNADDEWVVESQPDWVNLDKTSGEGKAELKLIFSEMTQGSEDRAGEVVFKLRNKDYRTRCKVTQYNYLYAEDEVVRLHTSSRGNNNNIIILGDGFSAKDISEGKLMTAAQEAYGYFFDIEPYKSYKEYFNVYTAISVSPESGIGNVNRIVYNRFNTAAAGGGVRNGASDWNEIMKYACKAPTISENNLDATLVIMIPNTTEYAGTCFMFDDGFAVAYCPMSDYGYPLDFRGVVQHEAGGHGFGKLGDEYIYHNAFIDACDCTCCPHDFELGLNKSKGWFRNLSLTGKMSEVDWSHFIFHPKYSGIVDIFEGGYMHNRNVYRSEQNSCMNNDVPYYSTISRQAMVERIKALAGEPFSLEEFIEDDVIISYQENTTKALDFQTRYVPMGQMHAAPQLMGERPAIKW